MNYAFGVRRDGVIFGVRFNTFVESGTLHVTYAEAGVPVVWVRHPAEWTIHLAGASWHPNGERCPTWTEECRRMLGGEA